MIKILTLLIVFILLPIPFISALEAKTDQTHYNWYEGFSITGTVTQSNSTSVAVEINCNGNIIDTQTVRLDGGNFWYGTSIRGFIWENSQCPQYSAIIIYENQTLTIPFTVEQVEATTPAPVIVIPEIINHLPVLTLLGSNPAHMTAGDYYTELGATATDIEDGNLTNNIVIDTSTINTTIPASYIINYAVIDSAANIVITNRTLIVDPIIIVEIPQSEPITFSNNTSVIPTSSTTVTNNTNTNSTVIIPTNSTNTNSTITTPSTAIPNWVKAVFSWWSENRLTDEELKDTIRFLVNNGIIEL